MYDNKNNNKTDNPGKNGVDAVHEQAVTKKLVSLQGFSANMGLSSLPLRMQSAKALRFRAPSRSS